MRCFDDNKINHVNGKVDPLKDIEIIETELLLSDIDTLERRKKNYKNKLNQGQKDKLH